MDTSIREQITNLRHTLHACPEISGQEKQTKETSAEIFDRRIPVWNSMIAGKDFMRHTGKVPEMESHSGAEHAKRSGTLTGDCVEDGKRSGGSRRTWS